LDALRERFEMPVIGVIEPGAQRADRQTRNGKVGVIGTEQRSRAVCIRVRSSACARISKSIPRLSFVRTIGRRRWTTTRFARTPPRST